MDITDSLDLTTVSSPFNRSVYAIYCCQRRDDTLVVIKTPRTSWRRERMPKLLDIWAKCSHPNIVQLIGKATFRGELAAVYEWQEYRSIRDYLDHHPTADPYQLNAQICEGVAYLHSNDIIHRYLHGGQILVSRNGVPRVQLSVHASSSIKDPVAIFRDSPWTAPELLGFFSPGSAADDVYGLGMTILETITRERPYAAIMKWDDIESRVKRGEVPPRPMDTIPENDAGNAIWDILCRCWSYHPADRPSAKDVCDVMRRVYQTPDGGVVLKTAKLVVTEQTTIDDLVAHYEHRGLKNYTQLLHQSGIASIVPLFDAALANVYKITLSGNKCVAVKCVKHFTPHKKLKRSARELSCWSSHEHENILPVLGFGVVRGDLAMVSPWMSNGHITEYVARNPTCDRLGFCIQLARAIAYLHEHNVIHGDIKGPNVLLSDTGIVQVTDFGVSIVDLQKIEFSATSTRAGTQRWLAPEILRGRTDSTKEADTYALGMTMIEIYTGEQPYGDVNWFEIMIPVITGELRPRRPVMIPIDAVGNGIWELMTHCWVENPSNRPASNEAYEWLTHLQNMN